MDTEDVVKSAPADGLAAALRVAQELGLPVFPCRSGKGPYTDHGFKDASTDSERITCWWRRWPDALVGMPTGRQSGILVVDVDPDGAEWYRQNATELGMGRVHKTPRGHHLLYRMPEGEFPCSVRKIAPGIDVRAEGGYVIWWPAHGLKSTGEIEDLSEPPRWIVERIVEPKSNGSSKQNGAQRRDGTIREGARNDYLSREAYRLTKQGSTVEQLLPVLHALNQGKCNPPLSEDEVRAIAEGKKRIVPEGEDGLTVEDFYAYMPTHQYIFVPSREMWASASVNARLPPMVNADGELRKPNHWLDSNRAVDQTTWAPGESMVIRDRLVSGGGWIERKGASCFNLYRPPQIAAGDPRKAERWLEHIRLVFPNDVDHIVNWLAHRVQRPGEKINHALVLGGNQGIGKDTILEPVKYAVGAWNFVEISPAHLLGQFNSFVKSVILRVNEARDLGDVDRYSFYEHMKVYTAAPPDVFRCNEKHIREHAVMNVCGVVITTNHKTDGIYLPADDRRHYVAWSELTKQDFKEEYWRELWSWYLKEGTGHVAAYLAELDLSSFDAKRPPKRTAAFCDIVDVNRAPEDADLADVLETLKQPDAITLATLVGSADGGFREWLQDRRYRRQIPHRLESAGYSQIRNDAAIDGLWKVRGKRQTIYARKELPVSNRIAAANCLCREGGK